MKNTGKYLLITLLFLGWFAITFIAIGLILPIIFIVGFYDEWFDFPNELLKKL